MQDYSIRLCVTTPIANEEETIERFMSEVCAHLSEDDRFIMVIDDVSTDRTRAMVNNYIKNKNETRISLIEAPENRNVVDAYVRGYREALLLNARWVLEMDAGFSHEPSQIPNFIQKMQEGYEYVGGSRFIRNGSYKGSTYRRLLSGGGSWIARLLLGTKMTDMTSGYQCFTQEAIQYVLDRGIQSKGAFFQTEMKYWVSKFRWFEIPINYGNTAATVPTRYLSDATKGFVRLLKLHYFKG